MKPALLSPAWQTQSLLLDYPDQLDTRRRSLIRTVAAALPEPVGGPLRSFVDHLDQAGPGALEADYVATFDHRKRCCLYLTYYAHGDTRKRGMALLALKQTYAGAGMTLTDDELPDHLAVVLEYAAARAGDGDPGEGLRLLTDHRAGIELLRLALEEAGSPWALVLASVSATLPPLAGDQHQAITRLAAEGPPDEQVGLAPYPTPVFPDLVPGGRS